MLTKTLSTDIMGQTLVDMLLHCASNRPKQTASSINYQTPKLSFISSLTGKQEENITANYWVEHIRSAVQFQPGIQTLHYQGANVLIEIGPQPVLLDMGMRCWQKDNNETL